MTTSLSPPVTCFHPTPALRTSAGQPATTTWLTFSSQVVAYPCAFVSPEASPDVLTLLGSWPLLPEGEPVDVEPPEGWVWS